MKNKAVKFLGKIWVLAYKDVQVISIDGSPGEGIYV